MCDWTKLNVFWRRKNEGFAEQGQSDRVSEHSNKHGCGDLIRTASAI